MGWKRKVEGCIKLIVLFTGARCGGESGDGVIFQSVPRLLACRGGSGRGDVRLDDQLISSFHVSFLFVMPALVGCARSSATRCAWEFVRDCMFSVSVCASTGVAWHDEFT